MLLKTLNPKLELPAVDEEDACSTCDTIDENEILSSNVLAMSSSSSFLPGDGTLLEKYKSSKLSVTDFSAQLWCENKLYLSMISGFREETIAMSLGTQRHLQLELEDHDIEDICVTTREDFLGIKMLNTINQLNCLRQRGRVREVWIAMYVPVTQCVVRGVIDELVIVTETDGTARTLIKDTKTRRDQTVPSDAQKRTSAIQLHTYLYMIEELNHNSSWNTFYEMYKCDSDASFTNHVLRADYLNLINITSAFVEAWKSLPQCVSYAEVEYDYERLKFHVDRVPYNRQVTEFTLESLTGFWHSSRPAPQSVCAQEKWKCTNCPWVENCEKTPLHDEERESVIRSLRLKRRLAQDLEDIV